MWFDCKLMKEMQGKSILVCVNTRFKSRGGGGGGWVGVVQGIRSLLYFYLYIYLFIIILS